MEEGSWNVRIKRGDSPGGAGILRVFTITIRGSGVSSGSIGSYLELHIEQGPVLEAMDAQIGLVTGISGPLWLTVTMKGMAGHAGSVPMGMRHDALAGSAKVIAAFDDLVREDPGAPTVGTVGSLRVFPDSRNIIPEEVSFTVDLRDMEMERRNVLEARLMTLLDEISSRYGLIYGHRGYQ